MTRLFALLMLVALAAIPAHSETITATIILASTTSVDGSGLLGAILPKFTRATGIEVKVLAQGTGQALATAARGDADLVLVHDPDAEAAFIAEGHGILRREIAWNDFILVGPGSDPAGIAGTHDAQQALQAIYAEQVVFVSRGDKSGTDALEKRLWKAAGLNPTGQPWYQDIGGGMGAALNAAAAMDAVTITDRGSWLAFQNKRALTILVQGDKALINRYDVIQLDPAKHPTARHAEARQLADWLAGPAGQAAIGAYQLGNEQLFHPDANGTTP
jgi:tungstate transport system substrate-binding protein